MNSSLMKKRAVETKELITEKIKLLDKIVLKISDDFNDNDTRSLPSSLALFNAYRHITNKFTKLDQVVKTTLNNSVISKNLITNKFETISENPKEGLIIEGYKVVNLTLMTVDNSPSYRIVIPNEHIPYNGHYFLQISTVLSDQNLIVEDNEGNYFGTIKAGFNIIEVECYDRDICEFIIRPLNEDVEDNFHIIDSMKFYYLTPRFINYMNKKISTILQSDALAGYIKLEDMNIAINEAINNLRNVINYDFESLNDLLSAHILEDNPHQITAPMIGASKTNHTHTPESIGAANIEHTHTPESIGASKINHTHTPESIGAADRIHTHDQYALKSDIIEKKYIKPSIILDGPLMDLSDGYNKVDNLPISILSKQLNHLTKGHLDIVDGIVSSNRETTPNTKLWDGLGNNGYMSFEETDIYMRTKINYKFHYKRKIKYLIITMQVPNSNYPTTINLYKDNYYLDTVSLVWSGNVSTIDVTNLTDELFSILGIDLPSVPVANDQWDLNIKIEFNDTDEKMFKFVKGLTYTYENDNAIKIAELTEDIGFDLTDMIIDHPYYVGLIYNSDNQLHVLKVDELSPYYGQTNEGIQPFLNHYMDSNSDRYFGDLEITTPDNLPETSIIDPSININDLYKDSLISFTTKEGISSLIIKHNFTRELSLKKMTLVFKRNEIDQVPNSIDLKTTDINGNISNVLNINNYLPEINSDSTYIELDLIVSDINLTNYVLTLGTNDDNGSISVNQIRMIFNSSYYNINRYKWDDHLNKKYIGVIYKRNNGSNDIKSYAVGDVTCLPVNGMNLTENNMRYEIVNPFGTTILDTEIIDLTPVGGGGILNSSAYIENIFEDKIVIYSVTKGRYAVHVSRNW